MKYLLSAAAASALMAGTAFAGNIQPAPQEPVIAPAPMPVYQSPDWSGFYAGGQLGYANLGVSGNGVYNDYDRDNRFLGINNNSVGDGFIGGLTLGYDHDFGNWVAGVGADYDWTDISVGSNRVFENGNQVNFDTKLESIWRLKARAGYKIGDGLLYATAGYAQADTKDFGSADGWFVGGGYEHLLTQNMSLGAEVLYHEFDNFRRGRDGDGFGVSNLDLDATTVQVRATFRF